MSAFTFLPFTFRSVISDGCTLPCFGKIKFLLLLLIRTVCCRRRG